MAIDWYTPQELKLLEATSPCPSWQRITATGWCVDKWWAGGPVASIANALALAVGAAAFGAVLVYASKVSFLRPVVGFLKHSQQEGKALVSNRRRRTRRRWRTHR